MRNVDRLRRPLIRYGIYTLCGLIATLASSGCMDQQAIANPPTQDDMKTQIAMLQQMAPYRGYLKAHQDVQQPLELLGGPITVTISQQAGGVHVALPDHRALDPNVFGTPTHPRAFGGTPGIDGVPLMLREVQGNAYKAFKQPSPFGDKNIVIGNGKLSVHLVDATATDAATSKDSVRFQASWQDQDGNTYMVRCCAMLATHGVEYPTFGGVVTNHLMHGSSRIGTALMPTMFTYAAFWGMGEVSKNGQVLDKPRLIHGMLTEYVRKADYQLAFDSEITPQRLHFHLMVPPMKPVMQEGKFEHSPVKTGFVLPNGMELPFWHVMFSNLTIKAEHGS
jgi:hypothetical protein